MSTKCPILVFLAVVLTAFGGGPATAHPDHGTPEADSLPSEAVLQDMSLEDLLNIQVITVSKIAEDASTSPSVMTTVTRKMIRERGYRTIWDVLLHVPGIWEIQDVNDKLVGVRGVHASTNQKFLLLINGQKLTENLWNLTDVDYNIPLDNVKHIEIIRGPGSAVYGRAALTAVINVITDVDLDGLLFAASLGNHGYLRASVAYAKKFSPTSSVEIWGQLADVGGQVVDLSASDDGATHRVDGQAIIDRFPGPLGGGGLRLRYGDWLVSLFGYVRLYKQPRGATAALVWQDISANDYFASAYKHGAIGEEHHLITASLERELTGGPTRHRFTLSTTYSKVRLRENTVAYRDVTFPDSWGPEDKREYSLGQLFEFDITAMRLEGNYFGRWEIGDEQSLLWGAEALTTTPLSDTFTSNYDSTVSDAAIVKTPIAGGYLREKPDGTFDRLRTEYLLSAYSELRWRFFDSLHISLGGRYDMHIKGEDYKQIGQNRYPDPAAEKKRSEIDKISSQFSPRLAAVFRPFRSTALTFKAIYSRSFIAPGYFYRYADPSTSYAGGPWLKPETLDNLTIANEGLWGSFGWKVLYFLSSNHDLLTRDTALTPARYESSGDLTMQGAELELFYSESWLTMFANYSFMVGIRELTEDTTEAKWIMDDGSIKNFPSHYGSAGITGRLLDGQISASVLALWHGPIRSPVSAGIEAGGITTINPSVQFDLNLSWTPKGLSFLTNFEARFTVFNVFNSTIRRGGTVRRPYRKAGTWVLGTLSKKF